LGRIYVLDLLAMLALVLLASVAVAAGMYIPAPAIAGIEFDALVILGVIAVAPVLEELVFRSWLSGRPGHGLAVLALAAGGIGFALLHTGAMVVSLAVLAAGLLTAIAAPVVLRGAPPMRWFAHGFAVFYWLSVLAFALVHLTNFSSGTILVLLPLVLPQFVLGILLGYVRVRIGLWGAMLLHGLHNASALALAGMVMAATG
jgi:membrane protease YdiL (CAAX protease family)